MSCEYCGKLLNTHEIELGQCGYCGALIKHAENSKIATAIAEALNSADAETWAHQLEREYEICFEEGTAQAHASTLSFTWACGICGIIGLAVVWLVSSVLH